MVRTMAAGMHAHPPELDADMSVFVGTGTVGADDIMELMSDWYPRYPTAITLYDLRSASMSRLTTDLLTGSPRPAVRGGARRRPKDRDAVNPDTADCLIISAFQALQETMSPIRMQLFHDIQEARAWLRDGGN